MATMKQMAAEYRIASAKLAMRIKEKEAMGAPKDDIGKLQSVLNDLRKIQRLLDGYYTVQRPAEFCAVSWRSSKKRI